MMKMIGALIRGGEGGSVNNYRKSSDLVGRIGRKPFDCRQPEPPKREFAPGFRTSDLRTPLSLNNYYSPPRSQRTQSFFVWGCRPETTFAFSACLAVKWAPDYRRVENDGGIAAIAHQTLDNLPTELPIYLASAQFSIHVAINAPAILY